MRDEWQGGTCQQSFLDVVVAAVVAVACLFVVWLVCCVLISRDPNCQTKTTHTHKRMMMMEQHKQQSRAPTPPILPGLVHHPLSSVSPPNESSQQQSQQQQALLEDKFSTCWLDLEEDGIEIFDSGHDSPHWWVLPPPSAISGREYPVFSVATRLIGPHGLLSTMNRLQVAKLFTDPHIFATILGLRVMNGQVFIRFYDSTAASNAMEWVGHHLPGYQLVTYQGATHLK